MQKGTLISLEGLDGSGKTSVLESILPRLTKFYHEIITPPGSRVVTIS